MSAAMRNFYQAVGPTVVFGGPSLGAVPTAWLTGYDVRSPARRGDLAALRRGSPGRVLLVDGLFGASLAVTPTECRHLLEDGWTVLGCSSMGALRAAELWAAGMIGVGEVYAMLRLGLISADADLAVTYHPDTHEEMGASMVHVRAVLSALSGLTQVERDVYEQIARDTHWLQRSWRGVLHAWGAAGADEALLLRSRKLANDDRWHPKRRDALLAVQLLRAETWLLPTTPTSGAE